MVTAKQIPELEGESRKQAAEWLLAMVRFGWNFHPDDDPATIGNMENGEWVRLFDDEAADKVRGIINWIFAFEDDPYELALCALKQMTSLEPALEKLRVIQPDKRFYLHTLEDSEKEMVECCGGDMVIAFDHEGTTISDPRISECGRFKVTPDYYGLSIEAFAVLLQANEYDGGPSADIPVEAWPQIAEANRPEGYGERPAPHIIPAQFSLDFFGEADDYLWLDGFHNPRDRWNGWANPYFTFEQALRVMNVNNQAWEDAIAGGTLEREQASFIAYDPVKDTFAIHDLSYAQEAGYTPDVAKAVYSNGVKLYGIGGYNWCWVAKGDFGG